MSYSNNKVINKDRVIVQPKENKPQEQVVQDKPVATQNNTIWAKMTQAEAIKNNVTDLFREYDKNANKVIDQDEYDSYSDEDETNTYVNQLFKQPSINLSEYAKNKFNIDNFDNMTSEEKEKVLTDAMNQKYDTDVDDKDSNYNKELERLKNGDYTKFEQDHFKLSKDSKLSNEQLAQYAKRANHFDEIKELSNLLINVNNDDDKKLLFSSLGKVNGEMKNSLEGVLAKVLTKLNDKDKTNFINNAKKAGVEITLNGTEELSKEDRKYQEKYAKEHGYEYKSLLKNGTIDFNKYTANKLNLDLSNMNEEDKAKAIANKLESTFSVGSDKYIEDMKRIKSGNFTIYERKVLKLGKHKLSNEDVEKYAKAALERQRAHEISNLLTNVKDEDSKKLLCKSLKYCNNQDQAKLIGVFVSSISNKKVKQEYMDELNAAGIKPDFSGINNKELYETTEVLFRANSKASIHFLSQSNLSKEQSVVAVNAGIDVNNENCKNGKISKEERNQNLHDIADQAYAFKNGTSDIYKLIQNNASESNRADIMQTLGSHVYQIEDENERNNALNGLTSSKYYTDDVAKSINESYKTSTTQETNKTDNNNNVTTPQATSSNKVEASRSSQETQNVAELKEQAKQYSTENSTTNPIKNTNEEHETKEISSSIKDADANGVTQKEKAIRSKKVSELLDYCFRNGAPSKKVEQIIFNKLSAASVPLIYNVFMNCNTKVKKYIFDTRLMTPALLVNYLRSDDMKKIPDEIKTAVEKYKEDNNLDQKNEVRKAV